MFPSLPPFSRSFLLALLSPVLISACNSSDTTSSVDTGDVALLITDAPTSAYDEINVEAEQVSLIGEGQGHEAHLMTKTVTFNLLDLRNTFRRLSKCKAPVGTYSKVRFRIKNVELVKHLPDGNHDRRHAHLKNKFIDLVAKKQFAISRHHKLLVKLDLDADKSLVTDPTTEEPVLDLETGDPVFDPNATVDTDEVPADTDAPPQEVTPLLMNELGDIRNLQTDSFDLCNTNPDGSVDCIQVNVSPDTVVKDSSLNDANITGMYQVQVLGHLDVTTDSINALHVFIQDGTQLKSYTGTLSVDVVNDSIDLNITAGSEAGRTYPVTSLSQSGIYDSAGNDLNASTLGDGDNVEVIGILNTFPPPETLQPGVIIISDQQ